MNLFASELITYLIKFIIFIAIAVIAILCGIKFKKNKLAKLEAENNISETTAEE